MLQTLKEDTSQSWRPCQFLRSIKCYYLAIGSSWRTSFLRSDIHSPARISSIVWGNRIWNFPGLQSVTLCRGRKWVHGIHYRAVGIRLLSIPDIQRAAAHSISPLHSLVSSPGPFFSLLVIQFSTINSTRHLTRAIRASIQRISRCCFNVLFSFSQERTNLFLLDRISSLCKWKRLLKGLHAKLGSETFKPALMAGSEFFFFLLWQPERNAVFVFVWECVSFRLVKITYSFSCSWSGESNSWSRE